MKVFLWLSVLFLLTECHRANIYPVSSTRNNATENLSAIQELKEEINHSSNVNLSIAMAALAVSIFSVIIGFISANRQNKANTITHFREKWLRDLGNTYCECLAAHENICQKLKKQTLEKKKTDFTKDTHWEKVELKKTKIKLLLHFYQEDQEDDQKPKKKKLHPHSQFWNDFAAYLKKSRKHYSNGAADQNVDLELKDERKKMEESLQKILRVEWGKLKNLEIENPFKKAR